MLYILIMVVVFPLGFIVGFVQAREDNNPTKLVALVDCVKNTTVHTVSNRIVRLVSMRAAMDKDIEVSKVIGIVREIEKDLVEQNKSVTGKK